MRNEYLREITAKEFVRCREYCSRLTHSQNHHRPNRGTRLRE